MFGVLNSEDDDQNPFANLGPLIVNTSTAMIILASFAVGLRFFARRLVRQPFLLDDWLILAAMPFCWVLCILNIVSVRTANYGRHFDTTELTQMTRFLKMLLPYEICWVSSVALTKLSIIAFYRRIFSTPRTKWPAYIIGTLVVLWVIACIPVIIFSCTPVQKFWNFTLSGHCQDFVNQVLGTAIPNLLFDIALFIYPIPLLISLQLPRAQKIAVSAIFMIGGLVILIAALRMVTIKQAKDQILDTTWVLIPLGLFTVIESSVGIICACLPSLTPLFRTLFRRTLASTGISTTLIDTVRGTLRSVLGGKGGTESGKEGHSSGMDNGYNLRGEKDEESRYGLNMEGWQRRENRTLGEQATQIAELPAMVGVAQVKDMRSARKAAASKISVGSWSSRSEPSHLPVEKDDSGGPSEIWIRDRASRPLSPQELDKPLPTVPKRYDPGWRPGTLQ